MVGRKTLKQRLKKLETLAKDRGIKVHYARLEVQGIRLKDGMCLVDGEVHIFLERRKPLAEQVELLNSILKDLYPDLEF